MHYYYFFKLLMFLLKILPYLFFIVILKLSASHQHDSIIPSICGVVIFLESLFNKLRKVVLLLFLIFMKVPEK